MECSLFARLRACGTDIDSALNRCMGNEALYTKFLLRFPQEACMNDLREAVREKQSDKALSAAHTLKGLSGNLGMDPLYRISGKATDLFYHDQPEEAYALLPEIESAYQAIVHAIEETK